MIEVRPSPGKGRGLFATQDIKAGTILSKAPVTFIMEDCYGRLDEFLWRADGGLCITHGVQSLVNHSKKPNCICVLDGQTDLFISIKDVKSGEELTVDYRGME